MRAAPYPGIAICFQPRQERPSIFISELKDVFSKAHSLRLYRQAERYYNMFPHFQIACTLRYLPTAPDDTFLTDSSVQFLSSPSFFVGSVVPTFFLLAGSVGQKLDLKEQVWLDRKLCAQKLRNHRSHPTFSLHFPWQSNNGITGFIPQKACILYDRITGFIQKKPAFYMTESQVSSSTHGNEITAFVPTQ